MTSGVKPPFTSFSKSIYSGLMPNLFSALGATFLPTESNAFLQSLKARQKGIWNSLHIFNSCCNECVRLLIIKYPLQKPSYSLLVSMPKSLERRFTIIGVSAYSLLDPRSRLFSSAPPFSNFCTKGAFFPPFNICSAKLIVTCSVMLLQLLDWVNVNWTRRLIQL